MTKRTLAALAALLAFIAALVAVPLATSETAEAHTKTVKRCAYDPFTNVQQCWNETVAHTHTCGKGMTGTYPNCFPIPPTNDPAPDPEDKECPAGTTGTPPNCKTQPPPTTAPPPTTTTTEPPKCPAGTSGTPPNCVPDVCPAGYSGTPPNCVKDVCPSGQTGTPPNCKTVQPPPECPKQLSTYSHLDREQHRHVMGSQRNRGGGTKSACHLAEASHCPSGQHEHVHGSQECHNLGQAVKNASGTHTGWTDHCALGEHSHQHSGACHAADPPYYDGVKIEKTEIARGYICHTTDTKPHGEVKSCARVPKGSDLEKRINDALEDAEAAGTGLLLCAIVTAATAGTGGLLCGGAWIAATIIGEVLCLQPWCTKDPSPVYRWNTQDPPASGSGDDSGTNSDGSGGGSGSGGSGGGSNGNDPDDLDGDGDFDNDDVNEARRRMARGELDPNEYIRLHRRNECSKPGHCQ